MKKILFLILLSVVLLAACSKSSAEASIEDPSVANDEVTQESKEIKQNLLNQLEEIKKESEINEANNEYNAGTTKISDLEGSFGSN